MGKKDNAEEILSEGSNEMFRRDMSRWRRYAHARTALILHFIDSGDSKAVAKNKVRQLSREVSDTNKEVKLDYITGDKQPLKDAVNASALSHMNSAAKAVFVNNL